jgi:hypothetical protein
MNRFVIRGAIAYEHQILKSWGFRLSGLCTGLERVERWKSEEYPAIRAEATKEGATVLFADEAAVRTDHHVGTTWAPIGQTRSWKAQASARPS